MKEFPQKPNQPASAVGHGEGRSPETTTGIPPVPNGLQRLLCLAGEDIHFRAMLLEMRAGVASAVGVQLSSSEKAILAAVPSHQLETMVDHVRPSRAGRRVFLRESAASAAVLLGGLVLGEGTFGCDPVRRDRVLITDGAASDMPPDWRWCDEFPPGCGDEQDAGMEGGDASDDDSEK